MCWDSVVTDVKTGLNLAQEYGYANWKNKEDSFFQLNPEEAVMVISFLEAARLFYLLSGLSEI